VGNTFAESGPYLEVIDKYGLSARHILKAVNEVLKRRPAARVKSQVKPKARPKTKVQKSKVKTKPARKR
jgi:hypothetical protein